MHGELDDELLDSDPGPTLGQMVRAARINWARLSLRGLARETGISAGQLSRIESGETERPSIKTVVALARALNLHSSLFLALAGHLDERTARRELTLIVDQARNDVASEYGDEHVDQLAEQARSVSSADEIRELAMLLATYDVAAVESPPELGQQAPSGAPDRALLQELIESWHSMTPERRWRLLQTAKDFSAASHGENHDDDRSNAMNAGVASPPTARSIDIEVTQGNLNNNHLYLRQHLDFFPDDAIGPANRKDGQGRLLTIHFRGLGGPVETDIAGGNKRFLRDRGSWGQFYALHGIRAGDRVTIERLGEYEYSVSPQQASGRGSAAGS